MDFLNKAFAQLRELFESMTPGARITAALLLAVVVCSLGYLFVYGVSGPSAYLMDGAAFLPQDLPAMEAAFAQKGLNDYVREGGRIRVPRGKQVAYMAALADANALPRNFGDYLDKALNDGNPFRSKEQQQAIFQVAKWKELGQIISTMNGIDTAWVMSDSQAKRGFGQQPVQKATVFVKPEGNQPLDPSIASSIRMLMPIAGLEPKSVAVADLNSGKTFYGDDQNGSADFDPYIDRKRIHEQEFRNKILEVLAYVPGVTVNCNVELGEERVHRQEEIKHDPKPVALQTTETTRTRSQEGAANGGRVGYMAQGNTRMSLDNGSSKSPREEEEESQRQEVNLISSTRKEIETVPMAVKRVTASVVVPSSYFAKVWHNLNPTEPGKSAKEPPQAELDQIRARESTNIQACVATLLPKPEDGADPSQLVTVTVFQDIKPADLPQPQWTDRAMSWLAQSWSTLGMIGLALISLVMLRSMVRAPLRVETPAVLAAKLPAKEAEEPEAAPEEAVLPAKRTKRFPTGEGSLLDELSDLVGSDPDAAATILRNWIGNAS